MISGEKHNKRENGEKKSYSNDESNSLFWCSSSGCAMWKRRSAGSWSHRRVHSTLQESFGKGEFICCRVAAISSFGSLKISVSWFCSAQLLHYVLTLSDLRGHSPTRLFETDAHKTIAGWATNDQQIKTSLARFVIQLCAGRCCLWGRSREASKKERKKKLSNR